MTSLGSIVDLVHEWYPPHTAEAWDAVGLVAGDPDDDVTKVMFAVDPTLEVAHEAAQWGADLLVVHHPLFLMPVTSVAATTPKGRTLTTLSRAGCALLTAHTNADGALGGVSEAIAVALGLTNIAPLVPHPTTALDSHTVFVPTSHAEQVREAMAQAGAGAIGAYDQASFTSSGQGRFRPLPGATPTIGEVGAIEVVDEARIEVVAPRACREAVVAAMRAVHPYEEPAFTVVEVAGLSADTGSGRVGDIDPMTLEQFAAHVASVLPPTAGGVKVAGSPDALIRRVALCGGAGDSFLAAVPGSGADVYVTSDLRHHLVSEFVEGTTLAVIDVAHWAAESLWLPVVESRLRTALGAAVETKISSLATDPWIFRTERTSRGHL